MKWKMMELIGDILIIWLAIVATGLIGLLAFHLAVLIFNNITL